MDLPDRFLDKIQFEPNSGCWLWVAAVDSCGYGAFKFDGSMRGAHRYAYQNTKGEIPDGKELDHLCCVRCCVNPDHLEVVSHHENCLRGEVGNSSRARNLAKTHCKNGHRFDGLNTIIDSKGKRCCRICVNKRSRDAYHRRKVDRKGNRKDTLCSLR